ncbi:hypothetical protein ACQ4WX_05280 [Streptomyces lasalocidi]
MPRRRPGLFIVDLDGSMIGQITLYGDTRHLRQADGARWCSRTTPMTARGAREYRSTGMRPGALTASAAEGILVAARFTRPAGSLLFSATAGVHRRVPGQRSGNRTRAAAHVEGAGRQGLVGIRVPVLLVDPAAAGFVRPDA